MDGHVTQWLTAYLHGELAPHLRERVSRHVRECDRCYAALCRERELARELGESMPTFGAPRSDQLARVLSSILIEAGNSRGLSMARLSPAGMVLLFGLVLLLLPALAMPRITVASAPDQPGPHMIVATATQSSTDAPVVFVVASPTAVAARQIPLTEPPAFSPSPVPVIEATLPY